MRKQVTNVVYKNSLGWHYGYITGDNWHYGILHDHPLVELSHIKFVSDVRGVDTYQSLKQFLLSKRGYNSEGIERTILNKFSCTKLYVRPTTTFLPDDSDNNSKSICSECVKTCKTDNVTGCSSMVKIGYKGFSLIKQ